MPIMGMKRPSDAMNEDDNAVMGKNRKQPKKTGKGEEKVGKAKANKAKAMAAAGKKMPKNMTDKNDCKGGY